MHWGMNYPDTPFPLIQLTQAKCEVRDPAGETGRLGSCPRAFRAVHVPWLVDALCQTMQAAIDRPAQVVRMGSLRQVHILGMAIYSSMDSQDQVDARLWWIDSEHQLKLGAVAARHVSALPPSRDTWLHFYRMGFAAALQRSRADVEERLREQYTNWVFRRVRLLFWSVPIQRRVREQIALTLRLDPVVLQLARSVQLGLRASQVVTLAAYHHVQQYRRQYQTLRQETPGLIALYALLHDQLPGQGESTQELKRYLISQGLRPAFWRLLCREGTFWLLEFLDYYPDSDDQRADALCDLMLFVQLFDDHRLPPRWLIHAALQVGGNLGLASGHYYVTWFFRQSFLRHLSMLYQDTCVTQDMQAQTLLREHVQLIMSWSHSDAYDLHEKPLGRVSLASLLRRALSWQKEKQRLCCEKSPLWTVRFAVQTDPAQVWQPVVLSCAEEFWQESRQMHHCVDEYVERCARAEVVVVSIRSPQRRRPLATAAFEVIDASVPVLELDQVAGFANGKVEPKIEHFVMGLIGRFVLQPSCSVPDGTAAAA